MQNLRKIAILGAVFCVVFVAVVLVNQTLQLSDAAARLHPTAGDFVFWGLVFTYLGEYNDRWDLGTDVVIIYFEDCTTNIERQIESWGYRSARPVARGELIGNQKATPEGAAFLV